VIASTAGKLCQVLILVPALAFGNGGSHGFLCVGVADDCLRTVGVSLRSLSVSRFPSTWGSSAFLALRSNTLPRYSLSSTCRDEPAEACGARLEYGRDNSGWYCSNASVATCRTGIAAPSFPTCSCCTLSLIFWLPSVRVGGATGLVLSVKFSEELEDELQDESQKGETDVDAARWSCTRRIGRRTRSAHTMRMMIIQRRKLRAVAARRPSAI
jgi:hypothetical protein